MTIFHVPEAFANVHEVTMPSKKKKQQLAAPPIASDYDTDTAYYTENQQQLPVAPPPERSPAELNMLVLKRWYPDIEAIVTIAPFAVLYNFSFDSQQWEKCDTEGSLFVCQLSPHPATAAPRYRVIILNRRNPKNFELDLVTADEIEVTEEFIIIPLSDPESAATQIHGIWVYKDKDSEIDQRAYIASVILECARLAEQATSAAPYDESFSEQHHDQHYPVDFEDQDEGNAPDMPSDAFTTKSINVADLFARPTTTAQPVQPVQQYHSDGQTRQESERFTTAADTAFFRDIGSPASPRAQGSQPSSQQNALLNLFKNAKKG